MPRSETTNSWPCRLNEHLKSVNIWQSYKQEGGCLVYFVRLLKDEESARGNRVLVCNFAKYSIYFFHRQTQQCTFLNLVINSPVTP